MSTALAPRPRGDSKTTANLRTILRLWISEGLTQANLDLKGWNSHVRREFPTKFESAILRLENLSREIGRMSPFQVHEIATILYYYSIAYYSIV